MAQLIQYARLEIKRVLLRLGVFLFVCILLMGVLGGCFFLTAKLLTERGELKKIRVAMVMEDGTEDSRSSEFDLMVRLASSMDSVRSVCTLEAMGFEEAKSALKNRELQAAILFPKSFYSDVMDGTNTPAKIVFPADSPFESGIFRELLLDGVSLISTAEAAIYSAEDAYTVYGGELSRRDMELMLTRIFTVTALERSHIFADRQEASLGEAADLYGHYLAAALTVLSLLAPVFLAFLFTPEEFYLERRLVLYGVPGAAGRLLKLLLMVLLTWGIDLLFLLALKSFDSFLPFPVSCSIHPVFLLVPVLGSCVFADTSYRFLGVSNGVLAILLAGFSQMLLSGIVVPSVFLPAWAALPGSLLPAAGWLQGYQGAFAGHPSAYALQLFWITVLFSAPVLMKLWGPVIRRPVFLEDDDEVSWVPDGQAVQEGLYEAEEIRAGDTDRESLNESQETKAGDADQEGLYEAEEIKKRDAEAAKAQSVRGERYLTWAKILLAAALRNKALWIADLLMLLFLLTAAGTMLPYAENCDIALYSENRELALYQRLLSSDSIYHFTEVSSAEELYSLVRSGRADCGFLVEQDNEALEHRAKPPILFVSSRFTTKGAAAKERVFSECYKEEAEALLLENREKVFGREHAKEIEAALKQGYEGYLGSDRVFSVEFMGDAPGAGDREGGSFVLPVFAVMLFLLAMTVFGLRGDGVYFAKYLILSQRLLFLVLQTVCRGLVLMLPGLLVCMVL